MFAFMIMVMIMLIVRNTNIRTKMFDLKSTSPVMFLSSPPLTDDHY